MICRWDRTREAYLVDGEPCRVDDYGDPTRHCTARRSCSNHVGWQEITCARCINRARNDVRRLSPLVALMWTAALDAGVTADAAMYAGPAADMDEYAQHREALGHRLDTWVANGAMTERQQLKELTDLVADDESHPANVLGVWCRMWAEDYGLPMPNTAHLSESVAFIETHLHRIAQDEEQDFPLFAREVRSCVSRMEAVLRNSHASEKGAPCPRCDTPSPKLRREYGHWCVDEDCTQQYHFADDSGDRWVCPVDREHWWSEEDYRRWVADVYEANHDTRHADSGAV